MEEIIFLRKDPVWEVFEGAKTLDSFKEHYLKNLGLSTAVPEEVKEQFKLVSKLLLHCYFEYGFLDLATNKALQTFELALKIRLRQLGVKIPDTLAKVIDKIASQVPDVDLATLNSIRTIRNHYAHPSSAAVGGVVMMQMIAVIVEVINNIYP